MDNTQDYAINVICPTLRKQICSLVYKPGQSISRTLLSEQFGTGDAPIRNALFLLENEGFVELLPKSGSRVSLINIDNVSTERFLRKSIELSAIPQFVTSRSSENIKELRQYIEKQKDCVKNGDFLGFQLYDDLFHQTILKGIGQLDVWWQIKNTTPNDNRIRLLTAILIDDSFNQFIESHEDITKAVENFDVKTAQLLLNSHLTRRNDDIPRLLGLLPDIFSSIDLPSKKTNIRHYQDKDFNYYRKLLEIREKRFSK